MTIVLFMQEELEKEGIWDFDRLSKPYVQKKFLEVSCNDLLSLQLSKFEFVRFQGTTITS